MRFDSVDYCSAALGIVFNTVCVLLDPVSNCNTVKTQVESTLWNLWTRRGVLEKVPFESIVVYFVKSTGSRSLMRHTQVIWLLILVQSNFRQTTNEIVCMVCVSRLIDKWKWIINFGENFFRQIRQEGEIAFQTSSSALDD